jgi:hypothetical protein
MARNGLASVDMVLAIGARAGWFGCYRLVVFSTLIAAPKRSWGWRLCERPKRPHMISIGQWVLTLRRVQTLDQS